MEMTGEHRIPAPRDKVWAALNDPEVLRKAIPGCQEVSKVSDTEFTARVTAKVGPVKATFTGAVTLSDLDPPNGYRISGEGKGGVAGFAKGGADVRLSPEGDGTLLSYRVHASVGGKLAQLGARLIDSTAKKMAGEFFSNFSEAVAGPAEPTPAPAHEEPAMAAHPTPAEHGTADRHLHYESVHPLLWVTFAIAVAVVAALLFGGS